MFLWLVKVLSQLDGVSNMQVVDTAVEVLRVLSMYGTDDSVGSNVALLRDEAAALLREFLKNNKEVVK